MSFFTKENSIPLLQAARGLYASSAKGERTGAGIAGGLLGYQQGKSSQANSAKAAEQAKFDREYRQAQMEKIQAERDRVKNPLQPEAPTLQKNYQLAQLQGFTGSFLDYQTALKEAGRTTIQNNVGTTDLYKVPSGKMMVDPENPLLGVKPIPGVEGMSGDAAKIVELGRGGTDAVDKLSVLFNEGNMTQETLAAAMAPGVFNVFKSANVQQYETLTADLKDMLGRLRSGGAITADELVTFSDLVPKFGDKDKVIEFKLSQLRDKFTGIDLSVKPAALPGANDSNEIDPEYEALKAKYL
jgi:hypothetical protein